MNLEGIINISGKTGLYKVISQGNKSIIVKSLIDEKKSTLHPHEKANSLEEIGIYTYEDTIPLTEVFDTIAKKENYKQSISHKCNKKDLTSYFREILKDYDEERVYISDIKKIIRWYNTMQTAGLITATKKKNIKN